MEQGGIELPRTISDAMRDIPEGRDLRREGRHDNGMHAHASRNECTGAVHGNDKNVKGTFAGATSAVLKPGISKVAAVAGPNALHAGADPNAPFRIPSLDDDTSSNDGDNDSSDSNSDREPEPKTRRVRPGSQRSADASTASGVLKRQRGDDGTNRNGWN